MKATDVPVGRERTMGRGASRVWPYVGVAFLVIVIVLTQIQLSSTRVAPQHARSELTAQRSVLASTDRVLSTLRIRAFVLEDRLKALAAIAGVRLMGSIEKMQVDLRRRLEERSRARPSAGSDRSG